MAPQLSLGREPPPDWRHVEKYPARDVGITSVATVNRSLSLPKMRPKQQQNPWGACVGWSLSIHQGIYNRHYYDGWWLWKAAQRLGGYDNDQYGAAVRDGCEVLRTQGHKRVIYTSASLDSNGYLIDKNTHVVKGTVSSVDQAEGITAYRWLTSVDQIRDAISQGFPVTLGISWYAAFDHPAGTTNNYWIGKQSDWGSIRGGHAITIFGAWDDKQAVRLCNSWGSWFPLTYLPYSALSRLLNEDGEAVAMTDH